MSVIPNHRGSIAPKPRRRFQWSFRTWVTLLTLQTLLLAVSVVGLWLNAQFKLQASHEAANGSTPSIPVAAVKPIDATPEVAGDVASLQQPGLLDPEILAAGKDIGSFADEGLNDVETVTPAAAQLNTGAIDSPTGALGSQAQNNAEDNVTTGAVAPAPHVVRRQAVPEVVPSKPKPPVYYRSVRRRARAQAASARRVDRPRLENAEGNRPAAEGGTVPASPAR